MAVELEEEILPSKINITRERGDTYPLKVLIKDSRNKPIDISTWSDFKLTVSSINSPVDDTSKVSQKSGSLATNGLDGKILIPVDGSIPAGSYFYDVQCTDSDNYIVTVLKGQYTVLQDITKD